jgi:hypothetical protein
MFLVEDKLLAQEEYFGAHGSTAVPISIFRVLAQTAGWSGHVRWGRRGRSTPSSFVMSRWMIPFECAASAVAAVWRLFADTRLRYSGKPSLHPSYLLRRLAVGVFYFGSSTHARIDSVAVLPFANANGDPNTEYLSDGITEGIIDRLSGLPNLKVISRTSAFRYKQRDVEPRTVAKELGVEALVTGRVIQRGDDLTVSVRGCTRGQTALGRAIGETVRRERRGTSVGAYPDASLFRLPRHQTVNTRDVWSPTPGRSSRALLVPRLSVLTREPSSVAFRGAFAAPQY